MEMCFAKSHLQGKIIVLYRNFNLGEPAPPNLVDLSRDLGYCFLLYFLESRPLDSQGSIFGRILGEFVDFLQVLCCISFCLPLNA